MSLKATTLLKGFLSWEQTLWCSEVPHYKLCIIASSPGHSTRAQESPSLESRDYSPETGSYSLSSKDTTVDLPEPLGPTSAVTEPDGMERLKSWNMGTSGRAG